MGSAFIPALLACSAAAWSLLCPARCRAQTPTPGAVGSSSPWQIPSPSSEDHPGIEDAPASDPRTYPDEQGFDERARRVLAALASNRLETWRTGRFAAGKGEPATYLTPVCMARLLVHPDDPEPRQYMNDDRSYKEHHRFAALNWSRYLPLFSSTLTPIRRYNLEQAAADFPSYFTGNNPMWMSSAAVLPFYFKGDKLGGKDKKEAEAHARSWLRWYVRNLYAVGQNDWDASSVTGNYIDSMLNVYDFCPDEECRLIAGAALDYYATTYALKYTDGVYAGPHSHGIATSPATSLTDHTGWLWWGCGYVPPDSDLARDFDLVHPITSGWRPNAVISAIAHKSLPGFETRQSMPNNWYRTGDTVTGSQFHETTYTGGEYTLSSLWDGGGSPRFSLAAKAPGGAIVLTAGHPDEGHYDGRGKLDQCAQEGSACLLLSSIPEHDPYAYDYLSLPPGTSRPAQKGEWWVMQAGDTFLAIYPLGEKTELGHTESLEPGRKERSPLPILKLDGRKTGLALQVSDMAHFRSLDEFAAAIQAKCRIDASHYQADQTVDFVDLDGKSLQAKYQAGKDHALVSIDGKPVSFENWAVYDSPYVSLKDAVLSVNNGNEGFVIDFSGLLPIYSAWKR